MKTHVISIHGFNVVDAGRKTVAHVLPFFYKRGCSTEIFDYGFLNLLNPRWRNQKIANKLSERVRELNNIGYKVVIVAHSNGCTITHLTSDCTIDNAVYINPALDRWRPFPNTIEKADVWHSPSDRVLWLSRLLPFHRWGDMGALGYMGIYDERVTNYNKEFSFKVSSKKHSDMFKGEKLKFFGPLIVEKVLDENDCT